MLEQECAAPAAAVEELAVDVNEKNNLAVLGLQMGATEAQIRQMPY